LVLVGFIPTPYQVGGEVTLAWPEGDRQQVRAPMRAIVEDFYVAPGDQVQVGDPVVRLSSRDLEQQIAAVKADIDQAQQVLTEAKREQEQAKATLIERSALAEATQIRANRVANRDAQVAQGIWTPEIDALVVEHDRLATRLDKDQANWEDYQDLYDQGAVSRAQLDEKEAAYLNTARDLKAKAAGIRQAQQQLADRASDELGNADYQQASVNAASQMAATTDRIVAQEQAIATHQQRLQALQQDSADLVLVAEQSGTILDDDLDLMVGQEVTPDSPLLRIAKLNQLTANVQVNEVELTYFDPGAEVTFRPTSAKLTTYDAEVDKILYDLAPDDTQQRRIATVRLLIDNADQQLRPGSGGYAKILSERIPLYQRLGREILKLVPSRFL
jgi:multidrug resistance efflux pump